MFVNQTHLVSDMPFSTISCWDIDIMTLSVGSDPFRPRFFFIRDRTLVLLTLGGILQ